MKSTTNNAICTEYQTLVREMMLESEHQRTEFDLAWVRQKEWEVVPVERAQHFIPDEIKTIVSALAGRGYSKCIAVTTEELGPLPACYELSISEEDFYEFNRELGLFRCLLTDQDRSWAISCTESYNLFAGPGSLIEAMLGKSVNDGWRAYWEFVAQPSVDPYGMLHQSATRYAAALGHPVETYADHVEPPKPQ
jgi:hypothetical protein